ARHCFGCHQGAKQQGDYDMTAFASLSVGGESGQAAIVPGKPDESYLLDQIVVHDGYAEMPKDPFKPLSDVEVDTIRNWIAQGAINDSPASSGPRFDSDHPPQYIGAPTLPSVDVSPDGKRIALAGFHEVLVRDTEDQELIGRWIGMSPRINSVRFSPDGKRLAAVGGTPGERGEVQVWDVASGKLQLSLPVTYDSLTGVSWSPDGKMIAFGATDNVVRAIDSETAEQLLFQGAHEDWVRGTAFTHDGSHLVTVARDMSCKLTEVATERFVDNITSITPGALSGGLSGVASHPSRNEIVIGGADGIVKVYRVFRETQRRIGDDANLIRSLPAMTGRIFSVAVSSDGRRIAAASTLDGNSEVCVWDYDFDGKLTEDLKRIQAKRVSDRSEEDKKKLNAYRNRTTKELFRFSLPKAAVYAVAFGTTGELWVTAKDGRVRRLNERGEVTAEFSAIELASGPSGLAKIDLTSWTSTASVGPSKVQEAEATGVVAIHVRPEKVELDSPYSYAQLVVTGQRSDGSTIDLTRSCEIQIRDWLAADERGLLRPIGDGDGSLHIRFGDLQTKIDVIARKVAARPSSSETIGAVDYVRDVTPVLSRLGCNQGTCHGAQKGKNGFRLSLRGYDPVFDLRALVDDLAARRINAAAPDESLMLRKPLGTTPHQGGVLMQEGDIYHAILRRWIADGSRLDLASQRVNRIEVFPANPIVQSVHAQQQVRVVAHYEDGSQRDVTREAFIESGNTEVATTEMGGLVSAVRRGEAAILARYEGSYAATTLTVMGNRD
ncbi:MAG: c-type cytochrome domain-containing protein, partial [Planctomycetota bacterium]